MAADTNMAELEDDFEIEVEDEVEDKVEDKEKEGGEDIVVESKPEECSTMASGEEEFCKFAKLSDANRKKLKDFWGGMLGYPADYVALLVKDYEK